VLKRAKTCIQVNVESQIYNLVYNFSIKMITTKM